MKENREHIHVECGPADASGGRTCIFNYARIGDPEWEAFYDAQDLRHAAYAEEAEAAFRQLVTDLPEFIDAWHHLAMLLEDTGREDEAFEIWERTAHFGLDCFPDSFRVGSDQLPWGYVDNRPFLRAYHGYAIELSDRGRTEEALAIFEHILALNPNDNQGIRGLLSGLYFAFGRPEAVLELCGRYPDDAMEDILYGQPLALLQLGRSQEAEQALHEAIDAYPLIAEELVKTRHPKPAGLREDRITLWGPDQAYHYWRDNGRHWKSTPGAIELVARCLAKLED